MTNKPGRWKRRLFRSAFATLVLFLLLPLLTYLAPEGMDQDETHVFFKARQIAYLDTILQAHGQPLRLVACGSDTSPVILFIHGSPGGWDAFKEYLSDMALLKRYRLIAVDRPGYGGSGKEGEESLEQQAVRIAAVFEWTGKRQLAAVVGHSYGGTVAVKLATMYPSRIGQLILMAPTIAPEIEEHIRWKRNLQTMSKWWIWHWAVRSDMRNSTTEMQPLPDEVRKMESAYASIRMPVTEIHGKEDVLAPYANQLYVMRQFKRANVDTVILQGENHFIPWTMKDRMVSIILESLRK